MEQNEQDKVNEILDYVTNNNLKGTVTTTLVGFDWVLGDVCLRFVLNSPNTVVNYLHNKDREEPIGHMHPEIDEVLPLIQKINSPENMAHIMSTCFVSSFDVVPKTTKKKLSWLLVRHYYSI